MRNASIQRHLQRLQMLVVESPLASYSKSSSGSLYPLELGSSQSHPSIHRLRLMTKYDVNELHEFLLELVGFLKDVVLSLQIQK